MAQPIIRTPFLYLIDIISDRIVKIQFLSRAQGKSHEKEIVILLFAGFPMIEGFGEAAGGVGGVPADAEIEQGGE